MNSSHEDPIKTYPEGVQEVIEEVVTILHRKDTPTEGEITSVKAKLEALNETDRDPTISSLQRFAKAQKVEKYLKMILGDVPEAVEEAAGEYSELYIEELKELIDSGTSIELKTIEEKKAEFQSLNTEERIEVLQIIATLDPKYKKHPLCTGILIIGASKVDEKEEGEQVVKEEPVPAVREEEVVETGVETEVGTGDAPQPPEVVDSNPRESEGVDNAEEVQPPQTPPQEEEPKDNPENTLKKPVAKKKVRTQGKDIAPKEKPVVEYPDFKTVMDIQDGIFDLVENSETDGLIINNVYDAGSVLLTKIASEIEGKVAQIAEENKDSLQEEITTRIADVESLNKDINNTISEYRRTAKSAVVVRMLEELLTNSVRCSSSLRRSLLKVLPQKEKAEEKGKEQRKEKKEAKPKPEKKKTYRFSKETDHILDQIKEQEADILNSVQSIRDVLVLCNRKDVARSAKVLQDNMSTLTNSSKDVVSLIELMDKNKLSKDEFKMIKNYVKKYIVRSILTLKGRFISFGRKPDVAYDPDAAVNYGDIGNDTDVQEGILALTTNKEVSSLLQEISKSVDAVLNFAKENNLPISLAKFENANKGDDEVDEGYTKEADNKNPIAPTSAPSAPAAPVPPAAPEEKYKVAKGVEDLFKPRDFSNPVPENIKSDEGFNAWLTGILNAHPEIKVAKETLATEESFFEIYIKQKPALDEIKKALDAKVLDRLFDEIPQADIADAKEKWFNKMRYTFLHKGIKLDEEGFMNKMRELIEEHKAVQEKEAILEKKLKGTPAEDGKIPVEDVYLSLNNTLPEDARIREFEGFIKDMEHNYEFYRGRSDKEDIHKMYRRYKHSHQRGGHEKEPLGLINKIKTLWKTRFGKDEDDAKDVERFAKNIYRLQDERIVKLNKTDDPKLIAKRREELEQYLAVARTAINQGVDPVNQTLIDLSGKKDEKRKAGQEWFAKLYRPYTDNRAMDADMQAKAATQRQRSVIATAPEQADLEETRKSANSKAQHLKKSFGDSYEAYTRFYDEVKISIATKKLKEIAEKLKKIKPIPKEDAQDSTPTLSPHIGHRSENEKLIAEIKTLFAYVREAFDKADPKAMTAEQKLQYKMDSARYIQVMAAAEGKLGGELRDVLAKNIDMYEKIAADANIPYKEKIGMFNALIQELTKQASSSKLKPLEVIDLQNVIKRFTAIKNTIPVPPTPPTLPTPPAAPRQNNGNNGGSRRNGGAATAKSNTK